MIAVDARGPTFHLTSPGLSYVMSVISGKHLVHGYWGDRLSHVDANQMVQLLPAPYSVVEPVDLEELNRHRVNWDAPAGSITDPGQIPLPPAFPPDLLPLE